MSGARFGEGRGSRGGGPVRWGLGSAGILGPRGAGAAELRRSGLQGPGAPLTLALLRSPSALCQARSCPRDPAARPAAGSDPWRRWLCAAPAP